MGPSMSDAEARMRKPAALKIRASPSLSNAFGPTRTVAVVPRFMVVLADLGRPDYPPVLLSRPLQRNATHAPISRFSPSRTRLTMRPRQRKMEAHFNQTYNVVTPF